MQINYKSVAGQSVVCKSVHNLIEITYNKGLEIRKVRDSTIIHTTDVLYKITSV